jgi:WD40 repeat protein
VHRVFLGHEGSIFGVRVSKELVLIPGEQPRRLLASCSDDRTIRVWDVSTLQSDSEVVAEIQDPEDKRKRHTGFSNASFDFDMTSTDCLAIGWGHISRVWTVQFLDHEESFAGVSLVSSGEDATSRTWHLIPNSDRGSSGIAALPFILSQLDVASNHNGKNMWSLAVQRHRSGVRKTITGGADSKIATQSLALPKLISDSGDSFMSQFTVEDIALSTRSTQDAAIPPGSYSSHRSSNKAEFFRSYTFIAEDTYLLTTNSGNVYIQSTLKKDSSQGTEIMRQAMFVDQVDDLKGYSVCTGITLLDAAFVAGSRGSIYYYQRDTTGLTKIHTCNGKVGELFVSFQGAPHARKVILLGSLVGQNEAQMLHTDLANGCRPTVSAITTIPLSEEHTGLAITSMDYISRASGDSYLLLGFRRGSIALYRISVPEAVGEESSSAPLVQIIERAHGREAVTSITWVPNPIQLQAGHIASTGRDGRFAIHALDLATHKAHLVHSLTLPVGPNIEGLHFSGGRLLIYGFTSKRFVLYDTDSEEELMSVDTGGAHRSWTFRPSSVDYGGGTLVWTRASSMHVCRQARPNHQVIRPGGHGREIKAIAISGPSTSNAKKQLIATGAEDTDIKISEYTDGEIVCRRTLRKHTTGIQHLQWSADGTYLFSSGGCEEFYIWRVRSLPPELGSIGVVCESTYRPESEHADLRIMSFDVRQQQDSFTIAMVFSNSDVKVSRTPSSLSLKPANH